MPKICQRVGEIPCFPDNEEMNVVFDSKMFPEHPVVFRFISHIYWEDGSDHPSTLSIYYDVESAENLLNELQKAIFDARVEMAANAKKAVVHADPD